MAAYYGNALAEHHRYRSWEHCFNYFRRARPGGLSGDRDHAALQLAFYLASWGMYRGSSFLLQHAFTVHRDVIEVIGDRRFAKLWNTGFGAQATDCQLVPRVRELIFAQAYKPFAPVNQSAQPTDTLISKIILGTFGCLPACDRYFIDGFKSQGFKYSCLNDRFVERVLGFCRDNLRRLQDEQRSLKKRSGIRYPLMKIVDMYFWQIGYEMKPTSQRALGRASR